MISHPTERSPATLFVRYWLLAETWTATQRAASTVPAPSFQDACLSALASNDGEVAHDGVEAIVGEGKKIADAVLRGRVLAAMQAVDASFASIHPRTYAGVTSSGGVTAPLDWLCDLRGRRADEGDYARDGSVRLVPRGPLLRPCRGPAASSADALADRFEFLTVVPASLRHDGRDIQVSQPVIPIDLGSGVLACATPGRERVGFVPLANEAGQIAVTTSDRSGKVFADFRPASGFDAAAAGIEAIAGLGKTDVVVMPELALTAGHVEGISAALGRRPGPGPRLVVAGSHLTGELSEGFPFNEARVLNRVGKEVWRQRKLWTAGMPPDRALALGIAVPAGHGLVLEDTACGDTLVVADVDGFGRCVVLICQDLTTPTLASDLAHRFQPDWVFVPILDRSIDEGRWAHSRAYGLSELSQARFVAVTSSSLAGPYVPGNSHGIGFALGPKEPSGPDDSQRAFISIARPRPGDTMWAAVTWRDGDWMESRLGTGRPPSSGA